MLKKDNLVWGLILGVIFPGTAFLLIQSGMGNIINNNPHTLYGLAALLNLLVLRYYYHFKLTKTAQGVILTTFILAMILAFGSKLI